MTTDADILRLNIDARLKNHDSLEKARFEADRLLRAFLWKSGLPTEFPPIICLMGGTGTGKSTIFNSLSGRKISDVGTRRPYTLKAVILVHEDWIDRLRTCPFLPERESEAILVAHSDSRMRSSILVDSPDFDSIRIANRTIAENFFIISDIMLFVTSQEKYADLAGRDITEKAKRWQKQSVFVMNKVASQSSYDDFVLSLRNHEISSSPLRIERLEYSPEIIADLRDRSEFRDLLNFGIGTNHEQLRVGELDRLQKQALSTVQQLESALRSELDKIKSVTDRISLILGNTEEIMNRQLDAILTQDVENQIRDRLQNLLRKYDILFVPRMLVRRAVREIFGTIVDFFTASTHQAAPSEHDIRTEDLEQTRAAVRLKPLESAIATLNLRVAEFLASDPKLNDLRGVASEDVPRLGGDDIRFRYEESFPGIERLLEEEFTRLNEGLSRKDEFKLYGSYTLWALLIITAEVVMGGGFSLLDALLNTVIMPFIPKWLLNLKILDVLREIGERVDQRHRKVLESILEEQAGIYITEFSKLLPNAEAMRDVEHLRNRLSIRAPVK